MFKNLIFDWSGTLVDDLALTLDASNYVFSQYGKPCMDRDEFRAEFQLPYPDYYARVLPQADLNELEDHFRYASQFSQMTYWLVISSSVIVEENFERQVCRRLSS